MARREQLKTYCGVEEVEVMYDESSGEDVLVVGAMNHGPNGAPQDSLWSRQEGVDFFLPPVLSLDPLPGQIKVEAGECATDALRRHFGLSAEA